MNLIIEINASFIADQGIKNLESQGIMFTPPIGEKYWVARVRIPKSHNYICTFPKFGTFGIGFLKERDWNTNLPYSCGSEEIFKHISHNKPKGASDSDCLEAINLLQGFVLKIKGAQE